MGSVRAAVSIISTEDLGGQPPAGPSLTGPFALGHSGAHSTAEEKALLRVLVVVPAFNEARNLPRVLDSLRQHASQCHIAVVDDGSTDDTAQVAASMGACVLRCPVNLGIGGAVQTGYLWARDHGYDAAVQIDGDGQHDPSFIPAVLAPIEQREADLVIGSRFRHQGGFRSTPVRRAGIRYLAWFLRLRCGADVTDPTSGFRAAGHRAVELFARQYPSDYPEPESLAFAVREGLRVREIPVRMYERDQGRTSINGWRTGYYLVKVTLALLALPARAGIRGAEDAGPDE